MRRRPARPLAPGARLLDALSGERMAAVRCAVGALLVVRPRTMAQALGAGPGLVGEADWAVRMFGVRELALGLGVLVAARDDDGRAARLWFAAGALSDGVDTLALTGALRSGRLGRSTWTRAATLTCTAGAVVAVAVQARDAARGTR